ncbi:MAG: universal stress protein [Armatimonadetes bacterium]|nr:universal stress protein [Armatimonadota bacterium]
MRVLAAVDGSRGSVVAAGYGALLASASGGGVLLAHVIEEQAPSASTELAALRRRSGEEALALARDFIQPFRVSVEERILTGPRAPALIAEAKASGCGLVAMGSRAVTQTIIGRLLTGSTALGVLDGAPAPVLLVPDRVADPSRQAEVRSLLVPTDGSRASLDAAELAAEIATLTRSRVLLLHCEEEPVPEGFAALAVSGADRERVLRGQESLGRLILHATQEPFLRRKQAVDLLHVTGTPAAEIVREAREKGFSLIVMGSYGAGEGFLRRKRLGSVAEAVLGTAPCPVIIHKHEPSRGGA